MKKASISALSASDFGTPSVVTVAEGALRDPRLHGGRISPSMFFTLTEEMSGVELYSASGSAEQSC